MALPNDHTYHVDFRETRALAWALVKRAIAHRPRTEQEIQQTLAHAELATFNSNGELWEAFLSLKRDGILAENTRGFVMVPTPPRVSAAQEKAMNPHRLGL